MRTLKALTIPVVGVGVGVALCLSGCGAGTSGTGEYRMLYASELETLNYMTTTSTNDFRVAANIEDCLVDYDNYGNIKPGMAESWESNEDMTEWTFHLRDGLKWVDKDGKEVAKVTANDWVATARYVNDAKNEASSQYMYSTGAIVHNAQEYYDYTESVANGEAGTVPEVKAEDIGVVAKDDKTLVYTLDRPCSFFPSITSYTSFLPVNQEFLDKVGDKFATSEDNLLYCGAYTLTSNKENSERVMTKNESYWDKDNVFITKVTFTYDNDMAYHEPYLFMDNKVDYARITEAVSKEWNSDPAKKDQTHTQRPDYAYNYFYCFNFDPQFDAKYEPENWKKAVNNENFRQAIMAGMDRVSAIATKNPDNAQALVQNTITPDGFASADGKDYTDYDALKSIMDRDSYNTASAVSYKQQAMTELAAEGVQFPVKILMPYNPAVPQWREECYEVESQLEGVLGKEFIDIVVEEGPESGFLKSVRKSGNYAFLKCNWGADYVDPSTWTQPFISGATYMFWDKSENANTKALFDQWQALATEADGYYKTEDMGKRYGTYAQAEALMIDHAVVVPFSSFSENGEVMSRINEFEGGFSPCCLAAERYKYMHLMKDSMSQEEYDKAYDQWKKDREASLKK